MSQKLRYSCFWALLGGLFFLPGLGGVHLFDWDEINFAEISREMLVLDDYLRVYVNFEPFWEKPPFFFWLQAASMEIFGINEFAARFPNALCGMISLVILYRLGYFLRGHRFGMLWAGAYFGSILPHLYFRSGILDPWFNLFMFLGLIGLIAFAWKRTKWGRGLERASYLYLLGGGLSLGLAILVKGPTALIIVGLTGVVYWIYRGFRWFVTIPQAGLYLLFALIPPVLWLTAETWANGSWFATEFTRYQYRLLSTPDAGHAGFPGYHFVVLLFGCFPASILALRGMGLRKMESDRKRDLWLWMSILFWVVLLLFTIVRSKIVHYSSMCYFPLTYLAAVAAYHLLKGRTPWRAWMWWTLGGIGGVAVLASLAMPYLGRNPELLRPLLAKDPFALGNLEAEVSWNYWALIPGLFLLVVLLSFAWQWRKDRRPRALCWLFGGTAGYIFLALIFFVGRIEGYSQRAAIEFYQELSGQDVYVMTYGFKSYAHIYYFDKPIPADFDPTYTPEVGEMSFQQLQSADSHWLLHGEIDKDVYVVAKINRYQELHEMEELEEIDQKNGFVFFRRQPARD